MKSLPAILAALALGTVAYAADEKPAATAPAATTPTTEPAAPAAGEKKHKSPEEVFKKMDTNGDGFISLDEFKASPRAQKDPTKAEEMFKKMDTNGDGKLSLEEFKAGHEHKKK